MEDNLFALFTSKCRLIPMPAMVLCVRGKRIISDGILFQDDFPVTLAADKYASDTRKQAVNSLFHNVSSPVFLASIAQEVRRC